MNEELERALRDYLVDRPRDKQDESARHEELKGVIRTVSDQVLKLDQRVQKHELDDERRHGEVISKFTAHDTRIVHLEDAEETTGVHNLEQLKEKAKDAVFLKRWLLGIVAAIVVGVGLKVVIGH